MTVLGASALAQGPQQRPASGQGGTVQTIDARSAGMHKIDGYMPLYYDDKSGTLLMEINKWDTEIL